MTDWDKDDFMSQWDKKYVSTNVKPGSQPYNKDLFLELNSELGLSVPGLKNVAYTLIVRWTSLATALLLIPFRPPHVVQWAVQMSLDASLTT